MPWGDLDAEGYTGIELWSFVTDSAERVNSIRELLSFIAAPGRFVDHPPQRNLDEWDRLCARRRCVALGGVDAHQVGIRVRGRVPLRLMAYRRSFRYLRTHLLVPEPLTRDLDADREAVFGALRAGHAYIAMDSLAPARGLSLLGGGRRRARDGRRGGGRVMDAARAHAAAGAAAAAARRRRRSPRRRATRSSTAPRRRASTASRPTATRTGASAPGSSRTRSTCAVPCRRPHPNFASSSGRGLRNRESSP